jgi:hypothetical protein
VATREIDVEGQRWEVAPAGRVTQYGRDEFPLVFTRGAGPERERRLVRYSPLGAREAELSLSELSDAELVELFHRSQPAWTSPELGYGR